MAYAKINSTETHNYMSDSTYNSTIRSMETPSVNNYVYDDSSGYWVFSTHDIPILIGAATGAIGLVLIILAAALIWQCCQYALQREKSSYSLDNDSERNSVSSHGSNLYNSESVMFVGVKTAENEHNINIKRSLSAPLTRVNTPQNPDIREVFKRQQSAESGRHCNMNMWGNRYKNKNEINRDDITVINDNKTNENAINDSKEPIQHRSYIYTADSTDLSLMRARSLPWPERNRRKVNYANFTDDDCGESPKVNFSKKRKNRMRNDSAAAIALNRSGDNNPKVPNIHKDTDTLVENEAVVVFDERTAL